MTTYAERPATVDGAAAPPTATGTDAPRPVVLDAWAARSCPVKTQHRFDPRQAPPVPVPPAADDPLVLRAEAARRYDVTEDQVRTIEQEGLEHQWPPL